MEREREREREIHIARNFETDGREESRKKGEISRERERERESFVAVIFVPRVDRYLQESVKYWPAGFKNTRVARDLVLDRATVFETYVCSSGFVERC